MSKPLRAARGSARALPARAPRFGASPSPLAGVRLAALLLDYRWLLLCLGLSLMPLLVGAQGGGASAIGLRVNPGYSSADGSYGRQLLGNTQLSYRYYLSEKWSAEATLGYRRSRVRGRDIGGVSRRQRLYTLEGALTLQREWVQPRKPDWTFYAGAGLGYKREDWRNVDPADGRLGERSFRGITLEGVVGFRYRIPDTRLELDLGLRPRYGGRGVGLATPVSLGLRWRLGGGP